MTCHECGADWKRSAFGNHACKEGLKQIEKEKKKQKQREEAEKLRKEQNILFAQVGNEWDQKTSGCYMLGFTRWLSNFKK